MLGKTTKKATKKAIPVKDLLFNRFKESAGMKVFIIKPRSDKERIIYSKVLGALKERGFLDYSINFSNIQIFLTDIGRKTVDEKTNWNII